MPQLRFFFIYLTIALLSQGVSAYTFGQSSFSLKRFLDANPSQLPLIEQLSVRVRSQPVPLLANRPDTQKIAVVLHSDPSIVFNQAWLMTFKQRMKELSIDFRLDVFHIDSSDGIYSTLNTFQKIEAANFDYMIVDRVDDHNRPLLERILKTGQIEVLVRGVIAPFSAWRMHPPLLYIGMDRAKAMQSLASYLARMLDDGTIIDTLSVDDPYRNETGCQIFLNELYKEGYQIRRRYKLKDSAESAERIAQQIVNESQALGSSHFIFSCTPNLNEGVVQALSRQQKVLVSTNAWLGLNDWEDAYQLGIILVTVVGNLDYRAIAAAEAIKADIESRLLPAVYMESFSLLVQNMDEQTRNIIFQQALPYSMSLWPR
ncbi:type 1 periplasmic-binding domain-containing protein [Marinomonas atlantica]|uniref:hypothetical protein n=1 Tax=Marinomonas atlantica TaxID=1806668 RepID=UPI00082F1D5C|nr:hypothetical protein [Marinomonas atlantica]